MCSVVTEEFVLGRKLVVHVAENGQSFDIDCDGSTSVEAVQRYLEPLTRIRCSDQLLLCLDMKLEPQQPLSAYKLPLNDREVFLYNRTRLLQDSPSPVPEQIDVPPIAEPPTPSSSHDPHPLDDSLDPARKALPSYERQFRYHYQCGDAIYTSSQYKFQVCEKLLREQRVQERAFETAKGSMNRYFQTVNQMYTDFMRCYGQQHRYHSDILVNFVKDIDKLKACPLHPSLQTEVYKCLLDFVKENNLRKWAENCRTSHRQFESKVLQFKSAFTDMKTRIDNIFSCKASANIRDVELMINDYYCYLNEQKSIMQSLSKDVHTVKKLVDECLSCQLSTSLRPHDAVSALGPMYEVHEKSHLPKMQSCDRAISKLLECCKAKKNEMNLFVHTGLQKVALIQHLMRDIRMQFLAFREAMERQEDLFMHLKVVRGIGPAYRACLAEVVRRKAYMKLYMGLAGQLAETLATKREVEVRRREDFLKAHRSYIPHDILASLGLFDIPSHCDVDVAPFDTKLMVIDIEDLDHYAPESLLGLSIKGEKHAALKGLAAMSSDMTESAEIGKLSCDGTSKWDSNDILERLGSVEIAGTSKLEVENARLKADLASAVAQICYFAPDFEYISLDSNNMDNFLKISAEKTTEALRLKDVYAGHLQSMLKLKQIQCLSYEKRIQELEQGMSDQFLLEQKLGSKNASDLNHSTEKADECKSEISGDGEVQLRYVSTEPMDEVSSLGLVDRRLEQFEKQTVNPHEGVDENMSGDFMLHQQVGDSVRSSMDSLMLEQNRYDLHLVDQDGKARALPLDMTNVKPNSPARAMDNLILELQITLGDKSNQLNETETKLKDALEEVSSLKRELERSHKLLDESQMNCAHLENCLHEARQEAHANHCAADRRASEYNALRASAVKMLGLFERLRSSVTSSGGPPAFAEALRSLALSLSSSLSDNDDDVAMEFRACMKVLADKVCILSRQRTELLAAHNHLTKELHEKEELVKSLYAKHQLEKQANKEKICFGRFELHEIAAFVLNPAGHYEAINRNCSNYYLSAESVALFTDNLPSRPTYIVGQIVHIERRIAKPPAISIQGSETGSSQVDTSSPEIDRAPGGAALPSYALRSVSNPYDLPIGCEYFVVTVAMLPDTIHATPVPPS